MPRSASLTITAASHSSPTSPPTRRTRPLQVDPRYVERFQKAGLDDFTSKVYAMVANLDENVGRLLKRLEERKLDRNTIVIFMTDNGPDSNRYNAGMRGRKGEPYQGGIRVPFFVRWPARIQPGGKVDRIAANIDIPAHATGCLWRTAAEGPQDRRPQPAAARHR